MKEIGGYFLAFSFLLMLILSFSLGLTPASEKKKGPEGPGGQKAPNEKGSKPGDSSEKKKAPPSK